MNPQQVVHKTTTLPLSYVGNLHIILVSPTLVNVSTGTLTLGLAVVQTAARPVLVVSHREFPELLDLDFDIFVFAAGSHTIVHFREGKKFGLH